MNQKSKILITGGAGFIGSHLCDFFINHGFDVICLDNLSTGQKSNIEHLLSNKSFTFLQGDIREINDCEKACKGAEYILHQAALGSVTRSVKFPEKTNENNVCGFINILNSSIKFNIKRIVFASSSSIYGDCRVFPRNENVIGNPLSPYAVSKISKELYGSVFARLHKIEIIGLRYFNVFGERQTLNGEYAAVIPKFVDSFLQHIPPTINGNGEQTRDYTYVANVVKANALALSYTMENTCFDLFNVACGVPTSVNMLFSKVKDYFMKLKDDSKNIFPEYGPIRKGDVEHSFASIEKIQKKLNYYPDYSLDDGLIKTIDWYLKKFKK